MSRFCAGAVLALIIGIPALPREASAQACAPNCWTITGQVVGPQGEPVPAVNIDLFPSAGGTEITLSNDSTIVDGSFTLTITQVIPAGFYDLVLQPAADSPYFPTAVTNQFLAGSTSLPTAVVLDRGSFLTGRVIDDAADPLGDIDLNFFVAGTATEILFSGDLTDADGTFTVLVTPASYDIEFRVTPTTVGGPYVPVLLEDRPLVVDLDVGDVVFHDGHIATGTVRDASALPVPGSDIDVSHPVTGAPLHTPGDNTDATGVFSILVPQGTWHFEVDPPTGTPLVAQVVEATVVAGGASLGVITLPDGFEVAGTTVQGGGTPVPEVDLDFLLSATGAEVATAHDNAGLDGIFSVRVEPETYDIQFRPPFPTGLVPKILEGVAVGADVDLGAVLLVPGPALTGTVTNGPTALEGVEVTLADSVTGDPVYVFGNDTDALGQYAFRQLPATYDVTFIAPAGSGLAPVTVDGVSLTANTVLDLDFAATAVPPVAGIACSETAGDVSLAWTLGAPDYDAIEIRRAGALIATLAGTATAHLDPGVAAGTYLYAVIAVRDANDSTEAQCTVVVSSLPPGVFLRGDPNDSGQVNIADAILMLDYLFGSPAAISCLDSLDANDSGQVNIADPISVLDYLFGGGSAPPPPFPAAGADPTADALPPC